MSLQKKRKKFSVSPIKPSVGGPISRKSSSLKPKAVTVNTSSNLKIPKKLSIVESHRLNKNRIYEDRSSPCKKNTQATKSSKTSAAVSTSKEKDLSPFYNKSSKEMFQKLWLAPVTDFADLTLNSLNGFCSDSDVGSYALTSKREYPTNKNYLKTFYQSSLFSRQDITEEENILKARKIRIYPEADQISLFQKCFGTTRFLYNRTHDSIQKSYAEKTKEFKSKAKKGCIHMITEHKPVKKTKSNKNKKMAKKRKPEKKTKKKKPVKKTKGSKNQKMAKKIPVKKVTKQCCGKLSTSYFCEKHQDQKAKYSIPLGFVHWRNKIVLKNSQIPKDEKWLCEIPYDTRQLAITNILANYKACITKVQRGQIKQFDIKFLSKKNKKQYFHLAYNAVNDNGILWKQKFNKKIPMGKADEKWFSKYLKDHPIKNNITKDKNKDKTKMRSQMIITRTFPGKYYLHVPYFAKTIATPSKYKTIAIDPGIKTFHTFYNPEGIIGKIGDGLATKIIRLSERIDYLKSLMTKTNTKNNDLGYERNKRKRRLMRKQCAWLRTKIRDIVDDHHKKTAFYYCTNYENIIIPRLNVKSIQRSIKRTFNCKTGSRIISQMMMLSHGRFIEKLKQKAQEHQKNLIIVDEHYTSKTCGKCGNVDYLLGGDREYKCVQCKAHFDRDVNAARNIMIKAVFE